MLDGVGGIGKSTMMRHFFINAIEKTNYIPILIELRCFNNITPISLKAVIQNSLQKFNCYIDQYTLDLALRAGCFLFLFDGFDEIDLNRENLATCIIDFSHEYKKNCYIVSSRPIVSYDFTYWNKFVTLQVMPLEYYQAHDLVQKCDYDLKIKEDFLYQFKALYEKHTSFASNPLLLQILLMTFTDYAEIPEKMHEFYAHAFDVLLIKHDYSKNGYRRTFMCQIGQHDFKVLLSEFCFRTFLLRKLSLSKDDFERILSQIPLSEKVQTEDFIHDLVTSICIFYIDNLNFVYLHRTFQEYFSALFLINKSDESQKRICLKLMDIRPNIMESSIFSLMFDMNSARTEKNLIIPILKKIEQEYPDLSQLSNGIYKNNFKYFDFINFLYLKYSYLTKKSGCRLTISEIFNEIKTRQEHDFQEIDELLSECF